MHAHARGFVGMKGRRTPGTARVLLVLAMAACGSSRAQSNTATPRPDTSSEPAHAAPPDASPDRVVERPFASTPLQAQSLIQEQIDGRMRELWSCVATYRKGVGDDHKVVVVDIGIDQEGNLIGVAAPTPRKAELDPTMRACIMGVLHDAPFPRSHAGIITVRQTFKDVPLYQ